MGLFNLESALSDLKNSFGTKDTLTAGTKLVGKALCNAAYAAPGIAKSLMESAEDTMDRKSESILKSENSSSKQREAAERWQERRSRD